MRPASVERRVLIACEGRASETNYFEALRRTLRVGPDIVTVLGDRATAPLPLVQVVIKERTRRVSKNLFNPELDEAWAVFDGDEHRLSAQAAWREALALASAENVKLAISNPCFELWLLLHFQPQYAPLDAAGALGRLRRHLPRYAKNQTLYPDPLAPLTETAIERARQLARRHAASDEPSWANPSTGMAALVRSLLALREPGFGRDV